MPTVEIEALPELLDGKKTLAALDLGEKTIGVAPQHATPEVVKDLYEWATVTYLRGAEEAAA